MDVQITPVSAEEYPRLLKIWEAAVRATHHFLSEANIEEFRPIVIEQAFPAVKLACARTDAGEIIGFVGTANRKVEMIFIDPAHHGSGIGRALMDYAIVQDEAIEVDVNEQNPGALAFYQRLGFEVIARSPVDSLGKPFPLLHLRLMPLIAALVLTTSCSPGAATRDDGQVNTNNPLPDSVVLERTVCFGRCPAYRLRIASNGLVVFTPAHPSGEVARDSIAPSAFQGMVSQIEAAGFDSFPSETRQDSTLCAMEATDHPTSVITLYRPSGAKAVRDYTGCYAASGDERTAARLATLRQLDELVDSTARSARWVRLGDTR
jgi:putative acetyltransferase